MDMLEPVAPAHTAGQRDVIGQIKLAFANPLPLIIGALIGALVPLATYTVGHAELDTASWCSLPGVIVVGGCLFSAITVYKWGERAFGSALKASGFVVLSEGVMTFSHTPWLSLLVLGFLIAINAVANGANLAVAHLDAEARRAAQVAAQEAAQAPVAVTAQATVAVTAELPAQATIAVTAGLPALTSFAPAATDLGSAASEPQAVAVARRRRPSSKAKAPKTPKGARASRRTAELLN